MAGSKSAYLEAALLDYVLGANSWTPPGNTYVALSTAPFDPNATGDALSEVTGGSYARQALANSLSNWPAAAGSAPATKSNGTAVTFPTATANWGTVLSVYIVDDANTGNVLYGADLAASIVVNSGSGFSIPVGQFVLSES